MATFKKYFKLIMSFIAFAVMSFIFAVSPVFTTYAAMNYESTMNYAVATYNLFMNSIQVPKGTIDLSVEGEEFRIPLLNSSFGASSGIHDYKIRVIDPAGQNHDYTVKENLTSSEEEGSFFDDSNLAEGLKVNVQNSGKYSVVYIVTIGEKTYFSNTYSVQVKNVSYELDFTIREGENAGMNMLLPSNLAPTTEEIELPVANVKIASEEDEYVELSEMIKPVVYYNGAIQDENEPDSAIRFDQETQKYYLIPGGEGRYTIEYTYNNGANRPTKTFVIDVSDDFVEPTVKDLTLTVQSMPKVELGDKDVTLPSITVSDGVSNNASFNLKSIEITKANNSAIKQVLTNNTYTFNMTTGVNGFENVTNYNDLVGNYLVKYTIVDAYGNEKSIEVRLSNVTDNTAPTIYMAYDYELQGEGDNKTPTTTEVEGETVEDVNTNYAVDLKANYGYSELVFPAIYAKDSVSSYSDFTFVRYIQNTNTRTIYYLDNFKFEDGELVEVKEGDTGYNYAVDTSTNPGYRNYNKAVKFQFTAESEEGDISRYAGEYTLGYYVYSNTVKTQESNLYSSGTTKYSFNVLSRATVGTEDSEATTPTTSISNIREGATVSSNNPLTVYMSATDEGDSRLKNVVFYYYNSTSDTELSEGYSSVFEQDLYTAMNAVLADEESDTNKHLCNLLDDPQIITLMESYGYNGFAIAEQDEVNATQFEIDYAGYSEQPNITIVAVSLNDYNKLGTDSRTLTIENSTETDAPVASIIQLADGTYGDLIESNTTVTTDKVFDQAVDVVLPAIQFEDDDNSLAMNVVYYVNSPESESAGLQYLSTSGKSFANNSIVGGKIKTNQVGTYYVIYTATDDAGNTTSVYFTFEVEDSSDPILNVEVAGATDEDEISKSGNTVSAEVGTSITFAPTLYASDGVQRLPSDDIKITIDDNGGLSYEPTSQENTYTFNSAGSYTVKVTGSYDGKSAVERVIYVNITMPEIAWDNTITVQTTARTGQEIILPDMTAHQGKEVAKVTVTVLDPDGHTPVEGDAERVIRNGSAVWVFTTNEKSKGTYRVTYTATTANGSIEQSYEIKVGDNVAPTFTIIGQDVLEQELVYDGETQIEYQINLNRSKNTLEIVVKNGDTTIYTHDTGLEIWDRDDSGSSRMMTSWSNLTVELTSESGIVTSGEETGQYFISGTGKCTLTLTMTDSYSNTGTKEIVFNVVSETEPEQGNNDTIVGTILIVASLVILAGVILFFTFTGKKGGTGKKGKKSIEVVEENVEVKEETETNNDEPKSGEVE